MSNNAPEPSITEFLAFTTVFMAVILTLAYKYELSQLTVLVSSAVAGWYARRIINSFKKLMLFLLTVINNWAKK
jgi:hypothetical protein